MKNFTKLFFALTICFLSIVSATAQTTSGELYEIKTVNNIAPVKSPAPIFDTNGLPTANIVDVKYFFIADYFAFSRDESTFGANCLPTEIRLVDFNNSEQQLTIANKFGVDIYTLGQPNYPGYDFSASWKPSGSSKAQFFHIKLYADAVKITRDDDGSNVYYKSKSKTPALTSGGFKVK